MERKRRLTKPTANGYRLFYSFISVFCSPFAFVAYPLLVRTHAGTSGQAPLCPPFLMPFARRFGQPPGPGFRGRHLGLARGVETS